MAPFRLAAAMAVVSFAANPGWLDVPFVRQVAAGCGSAAVSMVMQYWRGQDYPVDPARSDADRIHRSLKQHSKKGIPGSALKSWLEESGFSVFVFDGELADLSNHVEKGRPVIVCFAPGGGQAPLHYAVAVGVTDEFVYLNDPARGKLTREKRDAFARSWTLTGNWALLAVPRPAGARE